MRARNVIPIVRQIWDELENIGRDIFVKGAGAEAFYVSHMITPVRQ